MQWPGIIVAVLSVVAMWRIFQRAGHAGWLSIIPVANGYVLYKIAWKSATAFFISLIFGILGIILFSVGFAARIETSTALILMVLAFLCFFATLIIGIITQVKLAHAFGKGGGFACGLIFLNVIFMLILGFGDAQYVDSRR